MWTESTAQTIFRFLEKDIFPWLGNRPIKDVTAPEVLSALRKIESRGAHEKARRCRGYAGMVLDMQQSPPAIEILRSIHLFTSSGQYVFPSIRTALRPMSENTINAALRRLDYEKDEMSGHGFRSMASTVLHEHGWPHEAIERQLAHAERNKVSAAYNYAEHLPKRREMMNWWADYPDELRAEEKLVIIKKVT